MHDRAVPVWHKSRSRPAVFKPGAQYAQPQRQKKCQHKADASEYQRVADAALNDLEYVLLILKGDTKFSMKGLGEPSAILHVDGVVETKTLHSSISLLCSHLFCAVAVSRTPADRPVPDGTYKTQQQKAQRY